MNRRTFFKKYLSAMAVLTLSVSYGFLGNMVLRFLYPFQRKRPRWIYATRINKLKLGESMNYVTPKGLKITITRKSQSSNVSGFIALSSVCPHLGCLVRWEPQNDRYFCPCHNGIFDRTGKAIAGPPAKAGQHLKEYPLKIKRGLLFINVST